MEFRAFEPGIEVHGESLKWVLSGFKLMPATGLKFLSRFRLTTWGADGKPAFDATAWFPLEAWLECFEAIQRDIGANLIFEIGKNLGTNGEYPVPVSDIHTAMKLLDSGYHFYHRKQGTRMFDPTTGRTLGGIGHYGSAAEGDRRIVSVCDSPYPCVFDHGILTGIGQRFQPRARVEHDAAAPCRAKGQDSCRYVVTW